MKTRWLLLAALAATFLAHAPVLGGDFVYDDHRFIVHNPAIRSLDLPAFMLDATTASASEGVTVDIYRPVRTALFAVQWALFGDQPGGWHAFSLVLHLLGVALLFRLLLGLLPSAPWAVALAAALFGVHPMTSESVAWISSQGDLLALDGMLAALIVLERSGWGRTALGLLLYALACLAKESALMLPAWLLLRDLARSRGTPAMDAGPWPRTTALRVGAMALLAGGYMLLRLSVVPGLAQVGHPPEGVAGTLRGMLAGLVFYARGLIDPRPFTFDLRFDLPLSWSEPAVVLGVGLLASLLLAATYGLLRRRYLLAFACLGLLAALVPVSNVLVPLKTFVADRFFHPALVAVVIGCCAGWLALPPGPRAVAVALTLLLGVACGTASARNARAWRTDLSLWTAVRDSRPDNATAYYGIARAQREQRDLAAAERGYRTYLEFNPLDGKAVYELGDLFDEVAGGLYIDRAGLRSQTDVEVKRRQARLAQIEAYRRAFEVWAKAGYAAGRGSPQMRTAMLQSWVNAALDLPDLREGRFALDQLLLELEIDPRDAKAVASRAPWHHRRMRWVLAWISEHHARTDLEYSVRLEVERLRADLLRDVGLDPGSGRRALLLEFERAFAELVREREQGGRPAEDLLRTYHAQAVAGQGRLEEARELLRAALRIQPDSVVLVEALRALGPGEVR